MDYKYGDDVVRPMYVTESGDVRCDRCGPNHDEYGEYEEDYYPGPWDE